MKADRERRVRVAVRALAEAVPVVAPPAAAVRARARMERGTGRWLAPAFAAAAVLAFVVAVAVVPGLLRSAPVTDPGAGGDRPVLPAMFAALSSLTANYLDSPPSTVIALYQQGSLQPAGRDNSQQIVVGADGRTYRQLGWANAEGEGAHEPWHGLGDARLSPDGSLLAVGGAEVTVTDLATGAVERYPEVAGSVLSWSPDGRRLAVAMDHPAILFERTGVNLLELATGAVTYLDTGEPRAAAFSPDGRRLAVHAVTGGSDQVPAESTVGIFDLDGDREVVVPVVAPLRLAGGGAAWSPDGRLLVMEQSSEDPPIYDLSFVDASGSGRATPAAIHLRKREGVLLGWRASGTMLVGWDDGTARGTNVIAEVPLDGDPPTTVSQFSLGEHGWVTGLQLATGLVADAEIRGTGSPQRGPWSWQRRLAVAAAGVLVVVAGVVGWRLVRRRALPFLPRYQVPTHGTRPDVRHYR
jgi:hypothetical protein